MKKALAGFAVLALSVTLTVGSHSSVSASVTCSNTSSGNTALPDLGARTYQGEQGGLFPGGYNTPPAAYQSVGIAAGRSVVPLDGSGHASPSGSIVFLSIGMSNTNVEFQDFASKESADGALSRAVAMVNGAQGGKVAADWVNRSSPAIWGIVEQRLAAAGFSDHQVEVIWLKDADLASAGLTFETYARTLTQELTQITSIAAARYPNLRQVFVSARTYGGYSGIYPATAIGGPNPEPWAYQTGFADKWFVAQSIANPAQRPWVGWGPYFWTDGTRGRADGLQWLCSDTIDGTHPSATGKAKIDAYMHSQFVRSVFTPWFTGSSVVTNPGPSPIPVSPAPVRSPLPTPHEQPGAAHQTPGKPGATQHATSPGSATPNSFGGTSGPIAATVSAVSSLPAPERWSLVAIVIVLIGACLAGFRVLVSGRRRRSPIRRRIKVATGGAVKANGLKPDVSPEASEPPVLVGAGTGHREPDKDGQPRQQ